MNLSTVWPSRQLLRSLYAVLADQIRLLLHRGGLRTGLGGEDGGTCKKQV